MIKGIHRINYQQMLQILGRKHKHMHVYFTVMQQYSALLQVLTLQIKKQKILNICFPMEDQERKQRRKKMLMALVKRKREKDADVKFQELLALPQYEDLLVAIKHNKFGGFLLNANDVDKAEDHFKKSADVVKDKYKLPYSNIEMNMGNLWGQRREYRKAIEYYEKVLEVSPYNPANAEKKLPQDCPIDIKLSEIVFSPKINNEVAYIDAHSNLAVMYIQINEIEKAFAYCQKALELQPDNQTSIVNFTDILRQLGRKEEAIKRTWEQIVEATQKVNPDYKGFETLQIKSWEKVPYEDEKKISVLSVKWGTRYPASYVNKLYAGIKRYTTWAVDFYCFTEDPTDLHPDIKSMPLEEGWKKWWGKVTLFKDHGIKGRKFYIDLDMIITGSLDEMFEYGGQFSILRTGDLACEKNHKQGYNSSVMIWNDDILVPVYDALKQNFEFINKYIVRFDFWLEMTINNADYVQALYPKQVVDYLADAQKGVPENSRVVCFARKPKPDDYPAEWIRQYWVE